MTNANTNLDIEAKLDREAKIEIQNIATRLNIENRLNIDNRLNDYKDTEYTGPADIIKGIEIDSSSCSANSTIADILNLNIIRGGSKMFNGGGCGCSGMSGGCLTCKKGVKNITLIYKTFHVIIPDLYSKYKKDASMKGISKKAKVKKGKKGKTI